MVHGGMAYPEAPNLGIRVFCQQLVGSRQHFIGERKAASVDGDGDDPAVVSTWGRIVCS
jgi:hypothetical protein